MPEDGGSNAGYMADVNDAQVMIILKYGEAPLQPQDIVMVMQGWNKVLACKASFSEALLTKWRQMLSPDSMSKKASKRWNAMGRLERNKDVLAYCLGPRLEDAEELLMGFLDGAFRSYCPQEQEVQREAYRPIRDDVIVKRKQGDMTLECESVEDYARLFARCGVEPHYWAIFCDAFLWCMRTHFPYAQDVDKKDLDSGTEGAYSRAIRDVALHAIDGIVRMHQQLEKDIFTIGVPRFWERLEPAVKFGGFGQFFFKTLLEQHPLGLDYFAQVDMDALAIHFTEVLDLVAHSVQEFGDSTSSFREALNNLGEIHRQYRVPTFTYAIIGGHLLDTLQSYFIEEEESSKDSGYRVTAKQLTQAYAVVFTELMSIIYYPMLLEEKKIACANEFYQSIQKELGWTDYQLEQRLTEIEQEIHSSGTYTQTIEEITIGARMAWRNSAKCVGRISWDTLQVRDCRHVTDPSGIFREINQHLKIATAGDHIQSVMTVFKPQSPYETIGARFWSSQIVRYAAYKNSDGSIIGDPANLALTEYLTKNGLWKPPSKVSHFDVLPLVLKIPGKPKPYVYEIPQEYVFEVNIEHPSIPEISALGYKWTTFPALTGLKLNLGGVVYANIPFNRWFVSTEIVRNLIEGYNAGPTVAQVLGIDTSADKLWKQRVFYELERAVLYSFEKNGHTIADPDAAGKSFCTHVNREREQGRECPAQWSRIGGFLGMTTDVWHLQMRDFLAKPQYESCLDGLTFYKSLNATPELNVDDFTVSTIATGKRVECPKVLIAYGSETGNAEAVARRLGRKLVILKPAILSLNEVSNEYEHLTGKMYTHLFFVCSTFARGQPPSNAKAFCSRTLPPTSLKGTKFAVLAMGSSLYSDFCKVGFDLDKKIAACGSERFIPIEKIDGSAGQDGAITDWIELISRLVVPPYLEKELKAAEGGLPVNMLKWKNKTAKDPSEETGALCLSNSELVAASSDGESRSVRKITFELPEETTYQIGDHLSIQPLNSKAMLHRFLKCFEFELIKSAKKRQNFPKDCPPTLALEWQSKQLFDVVCIEDNNQSSSDVLFKTPTCLRDLIRNEVDLGLSAKIVEDLVILLQKELTAFTKECGATDSTARKLLQHPLVKEIINLSGLLFYQGSEKKTDGIDEVVAGYPTIVDFLERFRPLFLEPLTKKEFGLESKKPILSMVKIIVLLPRLQRRYYSISSSSEKSPKEVTITVGVLEMTTSKGVQFEGVCSNYLASLKEGEDRATLSIVPYALRLPKNIMAPCIMIGAGTGISPMMGLLEDKYTQWKACSEDVGAIHLFYGCRKDRDFLYKDIIKKYESKKMLTLHLALSRPKNGEKKYVQDRIRSNGKGVAKLLQRKDTHYFICGDAWMVEECFEACVEILKTHGAMSRIAAVQHIHKMQRQGRWQGDPWGIASHFEESKKTVSVRKQMRAKLWLDSLAVAEEDTEAGSTAGEEANGANGEEANGATEKAEDRNGGKDSNKPDESDKKSDKRSEKAEKDNEKPDETSEKTEKESKKEPRSARKKKKADG